MPERTETKPNLYWLATFIVEFSNTNKLDSIHRISHPENIIIEEIGTEDEIIQKIISSFEKVRYEKESKPESRYCLIKKIKLEVSGKESFEQSVQSPRIHFRLNREAEAFYTLPKWSLQRF